MTKIICTGDPNHGGITKSLLKYYPDTVFISRTTGYDLKTVEGYSRFLSLVKEFNVFINHSQVELGFQERVLRDVASILDNGHIISIGTILEFDEWKHLDPITGNEKLCIRNASLELASEHIKTTHLITSGFQRFGVEEDVKIDPDDIVETIKFIIESNIDIPLIYVDKVNDNRLRKWRTLKDV